MTQKAITLIASLMSIAVTVGAPVAATAQSAPPAAAATNPAGTFRARVDAQPFQATQVSASTVDIAGKTFVNVTGNVNGPHIASIGFNIAGREPGTYAFERGNVSGTHGRYSSNLVGGDPYVDVYLLERGSVSITRFDAQRRAVSGTFSAVAKNRSGATVTITDGTFSDIELTDKSR